MYALLLLESHLSHIQIHICIPISSQAQNEHLSHLASSIVRSACLKFHVCTPSRNRFCIGVMFRILHDDSRLIFVALELSITLVTWPY
jgi:hypothetical protein